MPPKLSRPGAERTRHRIAGIEIAPSPSNRRISANLLVDNKIVCSLPWIEKDAPLRWTRLIVCDAFPGSEIVLDVCEEHTLLDKRFRSDAYLISSAQQQSEVTSKIAKTPWTATFELMTPDKVEQSFAEGLQRLGEMKQAPSVLDKLGKARPAFKTMLEFGSAVAELHPTAKIVFAVCEKAWKKLEEQEQLNEDVQKLVEGLVRITDFVGEVKKHATLERLKKTIEDILTMVEDVSIYVIEHESTGRAAQLFRGFVDSSDRDSVKTLLDRFETLRNEFNMGVGADMHKTLHTMDLNSLLSQLQPVTPSGYDPARACQPGTREGIIADATIWAAQSPASEHMLWIYGQAGMGKSSIASSICAQLKNVGVLAASFFCKRDDESLRDPLRLINSISHGIASKCDTYAKAVATAIQEDRELCTAHMKPRYEGLIEKPLLSLKDLTLSRPLIVLVDALDECGTDDTRRGVLKHLWDMSKLVPWLKVIVTTRPDGDINEFFQTTEHVSSRDLLDFDASNDIHAYIEKELGGVARKHNWREGSIELLCEKAGGVFIWAATAKRYIIGIKGSTVPRLCKVLGDQKSTVSDNLDVLYKGVIMAGMQDDGEDSKALFRLCIGAIVVASMRRPLSIADLSALLLKKIPRDDLEEVVQALGAVLHIDQQQGGAVRFYHPSFADYVTNPERSGDLYIDPGVRNTELAGGCLDLMSQELRFNICALENSYLLNSQVPELAKRVKSKISSKLNYACMYWISHLTDTPKGTLMDGLETLLNEPRALYWLEVLSLLGRVDVALDGLSEVIAWLPSGLQEISECASDMYRFTSAFYEPISTSTPHLYVSALALAPETSGIAKRYKNLFPNMVTVTSGGDKSWPSWLLTLVHPDAVTSLAVSPDGQRIVSGSHDNTVRMWDTKTGAAIGEPLVGHSKTVTSVAFSPGGDRIVSGSWDNTVRMWDTKTGAAIGEPLVGHSDPVTSVAFSPSGDLIVSGSRDNTVQMWDTKTGAAIGEPLVGHSGWVTSVAFSPGGDRIVSGSYDNTVRMWDTNTGVAIGEPLVGHSDWVTSVAFSPDGHCIVSGSWDNTVRMWDTNTGAAIGEPLVGHSGWVNSVAFSPDGHHIVSGSGDKTVRMWDTKTGAAIGEPLVGHSDWVTSVAFSPGGDHIVSGSRDTIVRMWDTKAGAAIGEPLVGHSDWVTSVAFSPDGHHIVSGSDDKTVRMWDTKTGAAIGEPLVGHSGWVTSVAFSPSGDLIVSGSGDNTVRMWDTKTGAAIGELLVGHSKTVTSVAFSPDGHRIVSGSHDRTVRMWDTKTGAAIGEPLVGHSDWVTSVAFSPDGHRIVSGSHDNTARMWDTTTSENAPSSNHMQLDLSRPSTPAPPLLKCPSPNWVLPPHPELQGWVSLDGSFLLLWLPVHYRRIYDPRALYSISAVPLFSTIYFDFSKFKHGSFWSRIVHNITIHSVA